MAKRRLMDTKNLPAEKRFRLIQQVDRVFAAQVRRLLEGTHHAAGSAEVMKQRFNTLRLGPGLQWSESKELEVTVRGRSQPTTGIHSMFGNLEKKG